MLDWQAMFAPTAPFLELIVRGTVTYLALFVMQRIIGQRESGGLGITDLLVIVLVAQAAAPGLIGESSSIIDGVVLVATILLWSVLLDAISYRWPKVGIALKGKPHSIIRDGKFNHHLMRREFLSKEELISQLRLHGLEDASQVARAYLEPNGEISIIRRDEGEPDEPLRPKAL